MIVIDLNGDSIEVTDLQLAIMQADDYRHYRQIDKNGNIFEGGNRQIYWQDMYDKLMKLAGE